MIESQVVITKYQDKIISWFENNNKIEQLSISSPDEDLVGNIYVGRIKSVVKNLDACFVEIAPDKLGFLSFNNILPGIRKVEGEAICVQVLKAASKNKEMVLTTKLSIQGFLAVVEYSNGGINISRKISGEKKGYFKEYLKGYSKYSIIIRSNANDCEDIGMIKEEIDDLSLKLDEINAKKDTRTIYSCLYEAMPDYMRFIQGLPVDSYQRILSDIPSIKDNLFDCELYTDDYPLIKLFSVQTRINELLSRKVYLKDGGDIVIDVTEAMTVIDVNSGKNVSKKDRSVIALKTNKEAAYEIARQIRLRNLSGIIIIDFINMDTEEDKEELISYLKSFLYKDSSRCDFIEITKLGLVELTRLKQRPPIYELLHYEE